TFAGSQEYMAIEQLCVLAENGAYDLIVVDTPPTRHALDFLEAPTRIGDFLDRKVVRWFVRPYFSAGWSALRAMNRTAGFLLRRLEQATGMSALAEISDFFTSMSGLFENFQPRVERAYKVLRGAETAFVLVTGPEEQVLGDAEYLSTKMAELHMPLKGVVFNRVHREYRPAGRGARRPAPLTHGRPRCAGRRTRAAGPPRAAGPGVLAPAGRARPCPPPPRPPPRPAPARPAAPVRTAGRRRGARVSSARPSSVAGW